MLKMYKKEPNGEGEGKPSKQKAQRRKKKQSDTEKEGNTRCNGGQRQTNTQNTISRDEEGRLAETTHEKKPTRPHAPP